MRTTISPGQVPDNHEQLFRLSSVRLLLLQIANLPFSCLLRLEIKIVSFSSISCPFTLTKAWVRLETLALYNLLTEVYNLTPIY